MNVLIVFCHPEPNSFNGTLKDKAVGTFQSLGHKVDVSDLYGENFDPVEKREHYKQRMSMDRFDLLSEQRHAYKSDALSDEIEKEIKRIEWADLVIFQFPLWWHQQPAMLKGWFDRVFVSGGLYTSTMRYDKGYFRGKRAFCSVTSGAPASTFTKNGRGGGEIESLLRSINFSLHYMGFTVLPPFLSTEIQNKGYTYMSAEQFDHHLAQTLDQWHHHLTSLGEITPLAFAGWSDWDEAGNEKSKESVL